MAADEITVYADYACPFCYLGRASLERYREQRETPLAVAWRPFDLLADRRDESGALVDARSPDDAYIQQAWRNVRQLADEYGAPVPDEPITDTDSRPAQLVSLFVQDRHPDDWWALDGALYDAVWQAERDVGDPEVLADVVASVGLDADVVDRALGDAALESELEEQFAASRRDGVTGVPTFRSGDRTARGAVPPERFRELFE